MVFSAQEGRSEEYIGWTAAAVQPYCRPPHGATAFTPAARRGGGRQLPDDRLHRTRRVQPQSRAGLPICRGFRASDRGDLLATATAAIERRALSAAAQGVGLT